MFWDGRSVGLEGQALQPIANRIEMRGDAFPGTELEAAAVTLDSLLVRLRGISEYVQLFRSAFPDEAAEFDSGERAELIDGSTLARAIAAYERELVTRNSAFDRFVAGDDDALSEVQKQGLELFFTRAKCFLCHHGPMFSNYQYMVSGVPKAGPGLGVIAGDDTGREEHTGRLADRYKFRVPSLRNVELTAPYMHSGVFQTVREVVNFYNDGANPRHPNVTDELLELSLRTPLGLTDQEIDALIQFLRSLTDPGAQLDPSLTTVPATVPSGLTPVFGVGGNE
jgi:cytochrome c peroxidase